MMGLLTLFRKFFIGGCWTLAYRKIDNKDILLPDSTAQHEYKVIIPSKRFWYADPFPYQINNKIYVFCEIYDELKKKGCIGVTEIINGEMDNPNIIIEQDYHMSYPCVFKHNETFYMIPETSENKTIELYRAIRFPDKWVLDKTLVDNVNSVDSTLFKDKNDLFLITYEYISRVPYLKIYKLNMSTKKIELLIQNQYVENVGRPAGNIIQYNEKLIRPSQDERVKYGEKIIFNEIVKWEKSNFNEMQVGVLSVDNIILKDYCTVKRVHTINRTDNIEIIDVYTEKMDIFLIIKKIERKIKTAIRGGLNSTV